MNLLDDVPIGPAWVVDAKGNIRLLLLADVLGRELAPGECIRFTREDAEAEVRRRKDEARMRAGMLLVVDER